jgi:hypothetical protein
MRTFADAVFRQDGYSDKFATSVDSYRRPATLHDNSGIAFVSSSGWSVTANGIGVTRALTTQLLMVWPGRLRKTGSRQWEKNRKSQWVSNSTVSQISQNL